MKKNSTVDTLEKYKKILWPEIDKYLHDANYPKDFLIPKKFKGEANYQWKVIRDYPERKGKYLRPTLLILTALALNTPLEKVIKTAAAMQLSEEWLLCHDDIEDNSLKRRGSPALHRIYGSELAINAGDMVQVIMWKILYDNNTSLDSRTLKRIIDEFYTLLVRTILGQGVEIKWSMDNTKIISDDDWYFLADGKTSCYTIALPVRLGAIIGGASDIELNKLTTFSLNLGRAFQLVDDILDITSDFSGMKIQGNDIYEGKKTVILGHLLKNSNPKDKSKILQIMGKTLEEKTSNDVQFVISKMNEYKSIDYAKKLANKYKQQAIKIFDTDLLFLNKNPYRKQLRELIDFIVERKY